jgi:hypothetical protein
MAAETTDLGLAILMADTVDGRAVPVDVVSTLAEAKESAQSDLARRMKRLEDGDEPLCLMSYTLWVQNAEGEYEPKAQDLG